MKEARDVVSYVTSFVVFSCFFHDFPQIYYIEITLFCKATDYISTKRAHYLTVLFVCVFVTYENVQTNRTRTMWSVTLRLLWF